MSLYRERTSKVPLLARIDNSVEQLRKQANGADGPGFSVMLSLAVLIGIVGGLGAVAFHYLIRFMKSTFYAPTTAATFMEVVQGLSWYHRLLAPALGGLVIGPVIHYLVREARGHGVPEVMEAVALQGGKIRFRVAPMKALISAICIGSGGAAGREGPIVQIGASFGSSVGQYLKMRPEDIKTLLCAGAAAGVGGTFNAPLAGVIFGLEVFIRELNFKMLSPILLASVVGTQLANAIFGRTGPIFNIPGITMTGPLELLPYVGLGLVAAAVGLIYQNSLYSLEHFFENFSIPEPVKPAVGGLCLGALALWVPQIMATGYPVMEDALTGRLPLQMVALFMGAKILATCLTLGTGGSGGIFAPSLFIGSMMGTTYGSLMHSVLPGLISGSGPYGMVGMGAVFAGVSHAPVASVLLLFEMTRDPVSLLPLMLACMVSSTATRLYQRRNIYTTKLLNRGVDVEAILERAHRASEDVLEGVRVREAMSTDVATVSNSTTVRQLREKFKEASYEEMPVICEDTGELVGILSSCCILRDWDEEQEDSVVAGEIASQPCMKLSESDSLDKVLETSQGTDLVPVYSDGDCRKLVGVLSKREVFEVVRRTIQEGDKSAIEEMRAAD